MRPRDDLPPELTALVEAELATPRVPDAARVAIRDRLVASWGAATPAAAGATVGAGLASSLVAKLLIIGAVAAGAFGAGTYVGQPQRAPVEGPLVSVELPRPAPHPPEPRGEPSPTAARECPPPADVEPPPCARCDCREPQRPAAVSPPEPEVPSEAAVLRAAWEATERGDLFTAEEALERHAARFADGALAEEREALWIRVLVDQRRYAAARERAAAFHRTYPGSIHGSAVADALAEIP